MSFSDKPCKICNTIFTPRHGRQVYCSYQCYCKQQAINTIAKRKEEQAKRNIERKCLYCGKLFKPSYLHRKFCSESCQINTHPIMAERKQKPKKESYRVMAEKIVKTYQVDDILDSFMRTSFIEGGKNFD